MGSNQECLDINTNWELYPVGLDDGEGLEQTIALNHATR